MSDKTVFIGENNAGKSNVLRALDMFLDISPTTPHTLDDSYQKEGEDIEIEGWFSDLAPQEIDGLDDWVTDGRFWLKVVFPFDKDGNPDSKYFQVKTEMPANEDFRLDDPNADELIEIYEEYEPKLKDYQVDDWGGKYGKYIEPTIERYLNEGDPETTQEIKESPRGLKKRLKLHLPDFRFFQADRNIEDETKTTTSAVLGRLLADAIQDIPQESEEEIRDSLAEIDEKLNKDDKFEQIVDLEDQLKEKLNQQMPLDGLTIDIDIPSLEEILSNVNVIVDDGIETDIKTMGSGLHMAFILSCLWELSERDSESTDIIFGLEEPENDLHPHAQRQLYDTLDKLVDQGYQVLMSTHSAHLLSSEDIFDVSRVEQQGNASQIHSAENREFSDKQAEKIQRRMTAEHSELFFSKALLLIEGATEDWVMPVCNSLLDSHRDELFLFDRLGISVISTDGKPGMKPFLRLADCYSLPTLSLIDDDSDVDDGHSGMREEIADLATEVIELENDIEKEIFTSVAFNDFCQVMDQITPEFDKQPENLQKQLESTGHSEEEIMRSHFKEHSPSKPLFGKMMASRISEDQLPSNIVEVMETTRELALRK